MICVSFGGGRGGCALNPRGRKEGSGGRDEATTRLPRCDLLVGPDVGVSGVSARARRNGRRLGDGSCSWDVRVLLVVFQGERAGDVLRVDAEACHRRPSRRGSAGWPCRRGSAGRVSGK
jgi:hypothetical protein